MNYFVWDWFRIENIFYCIYEQNNHLYFSEVKISKELEDIDE